MEAISLVKRIESLIREDEISMALELLLELSASYSTYDEVLTIAASERGLEKDRRLNIIGFNEYTLSRNSIINSIIQILRLTEKEILSEKKLNKTRTTLLTSVEVTKQDDFNKAVTEFSYDNVFRFKGIELPYVPILGSWGRGENEYRKGDVNSKLTDYKYEVPEEFLNNPYVSAFNKSTAQTIEPKCRLLDYEVLITPKELSNILTFTFSKITYRDYLLTGQHIDDEIPDTGGVTYRDKYAKNLDVLQMKDALTSNICGVGIFIITRDEKIIITRQSARVIVCPNALSYSASGTMDWNPHLHPFDEIERECFEEIGHKINIDHVFLIGFGLETKRLYYQFSFVEYSSLTAEDILRKAPFAKDFNAEIREIRALPFKLDVVKEMLNNSNWEPVAQYCFLTLCSKHFGFEIIEKNLRSTENVDDYKQTMLDEWSKRAKRSGRLAVLSCRYPNADIEAQSRKYINNIIRFLGDDATDTRVLEIGCGIGLLTKYLVETTSYLHCIDISVEMIERNKEYLAAMADRVVYSNVFFQDFRIETKYDVAIVSLVLIHNTNEVAFKNFIDKLSISARIVYLFEHLDVETQSSRHTKHRGLNEILALMKNYKVDKKEKYLLFMDEITFVKLVRQD